MQISICDDDVNFAWELKRAIEASYDASKDPLTVLLWHDGEAFLAEQPACDVLFLDINMPGMNGFTVAQKLRHREKIFLIFVTMHDELVYDAIKFQPFWFIRKPYLAEALPEVMEALGKALSKKNTCRKVPFRTKTGTVFLDVDEIRYIEIYGHWLHLYVGEGETLECYGSLTDLEKQLNPFGFVRTHKSYLVNCRYVSWIGSRRIMLDDRTQIPLSRYRVAAVRERFGLQSVQK